eukprot:m.101238 g.101238  ORF g.101238 m.101238 type:complete len:720 (+) comp15651_c0_seq1:73-2232(+)
MERRLEAMALLQADVHTPHCLSLLNVAGHRTSRIVIGENTGKLNCIGWKRGPVPVFSAHVDGPVNAVCVSEERIFVAYSSSVRGFSRKGKVFFEMDGCISEPIKFLHVNGQHLLVCGNHMLTVFLDGKELHYYMSPDDVLDLLPLGPMQGDAKARFATLFASRNRTLRLLQGAAVTQTLQLDAVPLAVSASLHACSGVAVVCGLASGQIVFLDVTADGIRELWRLPADGKTGVSALVCCMLEGRRTVVAGREDGCVDVYCESQENADVYELLSSHKLSSGVVSLCAGTLTESDKVDIVAALFSGEVVDLTLAPPAATEVESVEAQAARLALINALQADVAALEQQIAAANESLASSSSSQPQATAAATATSTAVNVVLPSLPEVILRESFELVASDAAYILTLEAVNAIESVLIQSDAPTDVLDVKANNAVVTFARPDLQEENHLLALYRCTPGTTRFQVKIRSIEGHHGMLSVYVTQNSGLRTSVLRQFELKPLALHTRVTEVDDDRPQSKLKIHGQFSMAEMLHWLDSCLPGVPSRLPVEDVVTLLFQSTLLETQLCVRFKLCGAEMTSDNLSTLVILKDWITQRASLKNCAITASLEVNEQSVGSVLSRLRPLLQEQKHLADKTALVAPIKELVAQEGNAENLSPALAAIYENAAQLTAEQERNPCFLERLHGMVTDLYVDRSKLKGHNALEKIPQLAALLQHNDWDAITEFFAAS